MCKKQVTFQERRKKESTANGVTSKSGRGPSGELWQERSGCPIPRPPSCYSGHQGAPVFQKYHGKVTNAFNTPQAQHTPATRVISAHAYENDNRKGTTVFESRRFSSHFDSVPEARRRETIDLFADFRPAKMEGPPGSCYNL